ncbi:hypothetical protein D3C87_2158590 [compost metagenome]
MVAASPGFDTLEKYTVCFITDSTPNNPTERVDLVSKSPSIAALGVITSPPSDIPVTAVVV